MNDQVEAVVSGEDDAAKTAQLGLLLRKAREARGMTVADVVAALKYSPRQIEALEANRWELLPGSVFLRGIVRSYARLLKLDPAPLVSLIDVTSPASVPDVRPPEDMGVAMPGTRRQIPVVVALVILALMAAVAGGVWHLLAPVPPSEQISESMASTAPSVAEPVVQPSAQVMPAANDAGKTAILSEPAVPGGDGVAGSTSNQGAVSAESGNVTSRPLTSEKDRQPGVGEKALAFDFRGTSWVEVKDASQRIVLTGQYVSGGHETIVGRPPFQIVIGNAPRVELKLDGRGVDLGPHTRADVARLTLE